MRRFFLIILCLALLPLPVGRAEDAPTVALTFDDGPSGRFTRRLLEGLSQRQVCVTFLLCGYRLADTLALLPEGYTPSFFRPPGGAFSDNTRLAAREAGLAILNWSVDPMDWKNHNAAAVEAAVLEQVADGDVILLHDLYDGSVDAALAIVDKLRAQGFRFVTASQLAREKGVALQPGKVYRKF